MFDPINLGYHWVRNLLPTSWGHLHRIPPYNNLVRVRQGDCIHSREESDT